MQQNLTSASTSTIEEKNIGKPIQKPDPETFSSTRHKSFPVIPYDPTIPRLGRRESEPHSKEIMYLYDVLTNNFPKDRTMWDLHHYFQKDDKHIDVQFDISFYMDFDLPYELPSYIAREHGNRIPTLAVNVLSKSTWGKDLSIHLDYCRLLQIPLYAIFSTYEIPPQLYKPPFLRIYELQADGNYKIKEINQLTFDEKGVFNPEAIIDVGNKVPFKFGLEKRKTKFKGGTSLYRLILLHSNDNKTLPTALEISMKKADEAMKKADEATKKLEAEKEEHLKLQQKYEDLKKQLKKS